MLNNFATVSDSNPSLSAKHEKINYLTPILGCYCALSVIYHY